ncbi:Tetratricopeptide, SHNi-TPR domain protein [Kalmanozyma brasiliensis GHG001]|uniref:Tetratricopeptide SHNi-TPR domain-containing protein n=1 Tax=Kalmanozyma brasiliensis (strain GHG001) TaxID=1365824 RepID=V5EKY4_KALBG|nr:Tetratricopeptide, SHNi-TPR domain protein [Kalmanozyma brasiliensis GHG001]EST05645.1 Tetratricopeptide, SHNi-TPR domain protein [Kalmanozyma brasiliensis GHG001]
MAFNEQPSNPHPDAVAEDATAAVEAIDGVSARQLIDEAKRHFALKEYVQASDKLALALDDLRESHAEDADEVAPVLQLYGQSVLENFILNSGALGGGGGSAPLPAPSAPVASGSSSKPSGSSSSSAVKSDPRFSFTGDAEDDDDDEEEQAAAGAAGEGDDDDDLQLSFAVLDLARVIYKRILDSDSQKLTTLDGQEWGKTRIQAELAEVMNLLGDVGLESENFTQASADYKSSLDILLPLLNPHSRRLADAHLRLGLALEFHPDVEQRKGAKAHVQAASDVCGARVAAIQARIDNFTAQTISTTDAGAEKEKDDLADLRDEAALKKELADIQDLKKELDTKLEEYDTEDGQAQLNGQPDITGVLGLPAEAAAAAGMSTKDALQQAIKDAFLGAQAEGASEVNPFTGASKASAADAPVNNLSSMVKRKKKTDEEGATATNGETDAKKAHTEA